MKYKLLKDLPWANKGQIVSVEDSPIGRLTAFTIYSEDNKMLGKLTMTSHQFYDWFEEVDERWKPERDQEYFFIDEAFEECMSDWQGDNIDKSRHRGMNLFKTAELAQRAAEQIKALLKEFHKNNP